LEENGYSFIYGTIPAYPPAILRNCLKSIIMLSFHQLAVFLIKVFQQISSPQTIISFLKTETVSSRVTAMTVPSPTVHASDNMLSAFSPCRYAPCQVAAVVFHPLVV